MTSGLGTAILVLGVVLTTVALVARARKLSPQRQRAEHPAAVTRRRLVESPVSWLVLSVMFAAAGVFFALGLGLSPWLLALYVDLLVYPAAFTAWVRWRASGAVGSVGRDEAFCLVIAIGLIGATIGIRVARADQLASVPPQSNLVPACAPALVVPDQGNELNSSVAGTTSSAALGSKLYVTDAPSSRAVRFTGPLSVCDAGPSPFGQALVATKPGAVTLYVTRTDGDIYRLDIHVGS